jgi:hypothetical protein
MTERHIKKLIYLQAKNLTNAIPYDSIVYIHWKGNSPIVLPDKQKGYGVITSVRLDLILSRQFRLL